MAPRWLIASSLVLVTTSPAWCWPTPTQISAWFARTTPKPANPPDASVPANATTTPQPTADALPSADVLLSELETADADLRSLSAEIHWRKDFWLDGTFDERLGRLLFRDARQAVRANAQADAGGSRQFAVIIDRAFRSGRIDPRTTHYIFDGRVLAEKIPSEKKMTRTTVVSQHKPFDPLKLGEGPMPIPIAQQRDDILARYEPSTLAPEGDLAPGAGDAFLQELRAFVAGSVQLKLVPRRDESDERFSEIRLWYQRRASGDPKGPARWIPVMVRAFSKGAAGERDVDTIRLLNVKINPELDDDLFDTIAIGGWDVVER